VFERFYRGDPARPRAGGAGLGLAIAQWIASVHGARIALATEPGRGVRATVLFPRATATAGSLL
jgi:signal transduction histidine kinase